MIQTGGSPNVAIGLHLIYRFTEKHFRHIYSIGQVGRIKSQKELRNENAVQLEGNDNVKLTGWNVKKCNEMLSLHAAIYL